MVADVAQFWHSGDDLVHHSHLASRDTNVAGCLDMDCVKIWRFNTERGLFPIGNLESRS